MFTKSRLLKIFRATNVPALLVSVNEPIFSIQEVSDSFVKSTGEEREFIIAQPINSLFSTKSPIETKEINQILTSVLQTKKTITIEGVDFILRKQNSNPFAYFFCDIECTPVIDELENGTIANNATPFSIIITLSNITCYKKEYDKISIEKGLIDKEFLFGTWDYDIKTNLYSCTDSIYEIYGVDPNSIVPTMDAIQQFTHPNDLEKRNRIINYAIAHKKEYYLAYRIIRKNKEIKNIVSIGFPKIDIDGNLVGFEGMLQVVSSKFQLERKLFETIFDLNKKSRLIEKLIANIPVGIAVNKISTGEFTLFNNEFEKVYEWEKENLKDFNSFLAKIFPNEEVRNQFKEKIFNDYHVSNNETPQWREESIITETGKQKTINSKRIPIQEQDILITTAFDITEKTQLVNNLITAIERHNLVSKATDDAVFDWDIEKDIIFWKNSILTNSLGYKEGMERDNLTQWLNGIHPEDLEGFQCSLNNFLSNKEQTNWKPDYYRILKADETYAHIKGLAYVIRNKEGVALRMVGVLRDVSKPMEESLRLKLLESVVENMGDSVLITEAAPLDKPGPKIIYANPAFYELTQYTPEEILGKSPRILQGELSNLEALKKLKSALRWGVPFKLSTVNYKKNREPIWINARINPIFDDKGKCINWVGVQRDVTEEKNAETILHELNKSLLLQTQKLELSNKELEQFAYIASHDLQEPLKMITSFLQLLERKYEHQLDNRGREYIKFAVDGSLRLRQTIMELLEYSRVGKAESKEEYIDLNDLVAELQEILSEVISEKKANIETSSLPTVFAKKTPLRQVFQNLIGNALKYAKKDEAPTIRISAEESDDFWKFAIVDNGMGIATEYHEKIFVIFQRLHTKKDIPGTGLGLAITKKAIESMGGNIWLESTVGVGSSFYFTIAKELKK